LTSYLDYSIVFFTDCSLAIGYRNSKEFLKMDNESKEKEKGGKDDQVVVSVNEQPVKLNGETATGAEIKAAAIKQGVHIQQNFVLQEELPNGTSRVIGDNDKVQLRDHLRFTAIAPDDNS
jgi:hypothetical protein